MWAVAGGDGVVGLSEGTIKMPLRCFLEEANELQIFERDSFYNEHAV